MRLVRTGLAVGLVSALVVVAFESSKAGAQSTVDFVDPSPLQLKGDTPARVSIKNDGTDPVDIESVTALARSDDVAVDLAVAPLGAGPLAAGDQLTIKVSIPSTFRPTEAMSGQLVVRFGGSAADLDLDLEVLVDSTPKIGLPKRTVNVYSSWLFSAAPDIRMVDGDRIRVADGTCLDAPSPFRAAGGARDVEVTPTCSTPSEVRLDVGDLVWNHHADYVGKMGSGDSATEVTIRFSTFFLWPTSALVLGFLLVLPIQAWMTGRRELRLIRLRLFELRRKATAADQQFHEAASGHAWVAYSITPAVTRALAKRIVELDDIERRRSIGGFVTPEQAALIKQLRTEIQPVERCVADWPEAHDDVFSTLSAARSSSDLIRAWSALAGLRTWCDNHLDPTRATPPGEIEPTTFVTLTTELNSLSAALTIGTVLASFADRIVEATDLLADPSPDLSKATGMMKAIEERAANGGAEFPPTKVMELVSAVEDLRQLVVLLPSAPPPTVSMLDIAEEPPTPDETRVQAVLAQLEAARGDEPEQTSRAIGRMDLVTLLLIGVVAVWSGLAALYFGKPWGNVVDYVGAIVWAFTASSVLTLVTSALTLPATGGFTLKAAP